MNDPTLNPETDESQAQRAVLQQIVDQLARSLGEPESEPQPLEGGITNRNFRARLGGTDYVIRVPGKDTSLLEIDREGERIANQRAAEAGIAPRVAATLAEPQCIVTEFVAGQGMEPEQLREPSALTDVARSLRAIHELGEPLPTSFNSFRIVETYAETATRRGGELPEAYETALGHARSIEASLSGAEHEPVPCHNDLLAANFIAGEQHLWIVDWEYAGMGDRYFDLANFAVNNELDEQAEVGLLGDYFDAAPDVRRLSTLRLMKFMSDFREAMWGVVQRVVSELDFDFEAYADKHFDRMLETAAHSDFEIWLSEAREPAG